MNKLSKTVNLNTLMDRLRIQSIIQRLIRSQGREVALETILQAIELEFPEKLPQQVNKIARRDSSSS